MSTNDAEVNNVRQNLIQAYTLMTGGQTEQGLELINQLLLSSKIAFQFPVPVGC